MTISYKTLMMTSKPPQPVNKLNTKIKFTKNLQHLTSAKMETLFCHRYCLLRRAPHSVVRSATSLSCQIPHLRSLHRTLQQRTKHSPLTPSTPQPLWHLLLQPPSAQRSSPTTRCHYNIATSTIQPLTTYDLNACVKSKFLHNYRALACDRSYKLRAASANTQVLPTASPMNAPPHLKRHVDFYYIYLSRRHLTTCPSY